MSVIVQVRYRAVLAEDEKALNQRLAQLQQRCELEVLNFALGPHQVGVLVKIWEEYDANAGEEDAESDH